MLPEITRFGISPEKHRLFKKNKNSLWRLLVLLLQPQPQLPVWLVSVVATEQVYVDVFSIETVGVKTVDYQRLKGEYVDLSYHVKLVQSLLIACFCYRPDIGVFFPALLA